MKKSLFTVIYASFLLSCSQSTNKPELHDHDTDSVAADTRLTFNNGAKWQADSITNHNVIRLRTTANMFRVDPFPPLNSYQILGNDLSGDIDTLLRQCKMKGDDHEALHKWLTPIIHQSYRLKDITDTAVARKVFDSLDQRIGLFHQYFE